MSDRAPSCGALHCQRQAAVTITDAAAPQRPPVRSCAGHVPLLCDGVERPVVRALEVS